MRPLLPILIAAVSILGCGGAASHTPKDTFASTCGTCHTLADAGTQGTFGPNLDELDPDEARVRAAIANGPGAMPDGLLDGAKADAVAKYVGSVAGSDG